VALPDDPTGKHLQHREYSGQGGANAKIPSWPSKVTWLSRDFRTKIGRIGDSCARMRWKSAARKQSQAKFCVCRAA